MEATFNGEGEEEMGLACFLFGLGRRRTWRSARYETCHHTGACFTTQETSTQEYSCHHTGGGWRMLHTRDLR